MRRLAGRWAGTVAGRAGGAGKPLAAHAGSVGPSRRRAQSGGARAMERRPGGRAAAVAAAVSGDVGDGQEPRLGLGPPCSEEGGPWPVSAPSLAGGWA